MAGCIAACSAMACSIVACSAMACSATAWAGLDSGAAQISLIARLLPSAELSLDMPSVKAQREQQADVSVVKTAQGSAEVVAPANSVVAIPFTIQMNGRSGRVTIVNRSKGSAPVVDAVHGAGDCDWVHASVPVEKTRVVASLTGCTPHHSQQGTLQIQCADSAAAITMTIEPSD